MGLNPVLHKATSMLIKCAATRRQSRNGVTILVTCVFQIFPSICLSFEGREVIKGILRKFRESAWDVWNDAGDAPGTRGSLEAGSRRSQPGLMDAPHRTRTTSKVRQHVIRWLIVYSYERFGGCGLPGQGQNFAQKINPIWRMDIGHSGCIFLNSI